jgi:hypothetical protein
MVHLDPSLSAPDAASPATADARARIGRQMAMLARLAEIGMEIAEACGRDARAAAAAAEDGAVPSPDQRRDPGLVFARVARAVRMTIGLEQRLAGDLADLDRADARAEQARTDTRRIRLSRLVGQAARASVEASLTARRASESPAEAWARGADEDAVEDEIERLSYEAYERLIDAEDDDLDGLSFDAAVAAVCKDLGLSPDWTARLRGAVAPPRARDVQRDIAEDHPNPALEAAAPDSPPARRPRSLAGRPPDPGPSPQPERRPAALS